MNILVTNDDGIHAPGIKALAAVATKFGKVTVIAPDRDRSAASHSLTVSRPLRISAVADDCLAVDGTPTDCVHIAITGFLQNKPDLVIAGINSGSNLGDDVIYSGTVAAAMEARFLGVPAIAVSLASPTGNYQHYQTAAAIVEKLLSHVSSIKLAASTILNVNVPDIELNQVQGIKIVRLGKRHLAEKVVTAKDPRGRPIYWIGPPGKGQDSGEGTDFHAIRQGYVTITPLTSDLTFYDGMEGVNLWIKKLQQ